MTSIQAMQAPQYVTQPNYNAVKIDINNPEVKTQEPVKQTEKTAYTAPMYAYPEASVYDVPVQSIYNPQPSQPKVVEAPVNNAPIVPPPVIVPAPVKSEQKAPAQVVNVKEPQKMDSKIDVNDFINKLTSPNYEIQAKTMAVISEIAQVSPAAATELLDVKVVDTLLGIMTKDTTGLQGPSAQQLQAREKIITGKPVTESEKADANITTPMELAERNKQYSMYTVAILQKLYASEIEKTNNAVVQMTELPGAAGIVEQLKNNPNPMVRAAGVDALSYIQRPEYKKDLTTLFTIAQKDQDAIVRDSATIALDKLAKLEVAPEQTKAVA